LLFNEDNFAKKVRRDKVFDDNEDGDDDDKDKEIP
jgi:hypothetical protein